MRPLLPDGLTSLVCYYNQLTTLPLLPDGLTHLNCSGNPIVWYARIKDAKRIKLGFIVARTKRMVCKYYARQLAVQVIQRNCESWLDKPVTNDGKMGIRVRIGMRLASGYESMCPPATF